MSLDKNYVTSFLKDLSEQLLMKANFIDDNSLLNGKIAAAIFMYNYSELIDEEIYYAFANELTLEIVENLKESDISYLFGLTGIGAGIQLLLENEIIETSDSSELFAEIYLKISKQLLWVDQSISSIGASIFLALQLVRYNTYVISEFERLLHLERIVAHIDLIHLYFRRKTYLDNISLTEQMSTIADFKSVFLFVDQAYYSMCLLKITSDQKIYPEISCRTIQELRTKVQRYLDYYLTTDFDSSPIYDPVSHLHLLVKVYSIYDVNKFEGPLREEVDKSISKLILKKNFKIEGYKTFLHIETLNILDKINTIKETKSLSNSVTSYLNTLIKFHSARNFSVLEDKHKHVGIDGLAGIGLTCLSLIKSSTINWEQLIFCSKENII